MQELAGKHLILPSRADNFLQIKAPLSTGNLGRTKQRACIQPELLVPLEQHSLPSSKILLGKEKVCCKQRHN